MARLQMSLRLKTDAINQARITTSQKPIFQTRARAHYSLYSFSINSKNVFP